MSDRPDAAATLDAFADLIAERIGARLGAPASMRWRPLGTVAAQLEWAPRHLREFCDEHEVPVGGTRKSPLVDFEALERAIASTAKTKPRPTRVPSDAKPANTNHDGLDDDDAETFALSGVRVVSARTRKRG